MNIFESFVESLTRSLFFLLWSSSNHFSPLSISTVASRCQLSLPWLSGFLQALVGLQILDSFFEVFFGLLTNLSILRFPKSVTSNTKRTFCSQSTRNFTLELGSSSTDKRCLINDTVFRSIVPCFNGLEKSLFSTENLNS